MAIRYSMSQDTFLKTTNSSQSHKEENCPRTSCLEANLYQPEPDQQQLKNGDIQQQSNCNCTNISVMQLFHEMKQEFPTIPDFVINQHVVDNCHDRATCKARLQSEVNCHLVPVQTYPAQLLRILNKNSMCTNRKQPKSTVPSIETKSCSNSSNSNQNCTKNSNKIFRINEAVDSPKNNTCNSSEGAQALVPDKKDMRSGLCNIQIKTYLVDQNKYLDVLEKEPSEQLPVVPQRPTTLQLNHEPYSKDHWFTQNKQELSNGQTTDNRRSIRKCSSPVVSPSHSQGTPTAPTTSTLSPENCGTSYSTSIQSPAHYPDSRTAEISVNVCLSPSSYRNRNPPQRHQSTINVRPELPFTRNIESSGPHQKSYTSVNLVLRQPSSSPQTPIDITVGPNLTYSSSSYHAKLGYQNNYHITVTDDGGVFSAFRIRPISYHPSVRSIDKDANKEAVHDSKADAVNNSTFQNSVAKTAHSNEQSDVYKIIMRQHNQMERLSEVLRKNKNKLELVRKEVKCVMQSVSSTDGVSERLDSEIEKLRCDCQAMLNEIENSKPYGLSENSIEHTNSIKSRQHQPFPKQKPHRFPPPAISVNCLRKHQQSFPIELASQRQQSITYNDDDDDDDPSDFGVGD